MLTPDAAFEHATSPPPTALENPHQDNPVGIDPITRRVFFIPASPDHHAFCRNIFSSKLLRSFQRSRWIDTAENSIYFIYASQVPAIFFTNRSYVFANIRSLRSMQPIDRQRFHQPAVEFSTNLIIRCTYSQSRTILKFNVEDADPFGRIQLPHT